MDGKQSSSSSELVAEKMQEVGTQVSSEPSPVDLIEGRLQKLLENDQTDTSAWIALLAEVEKDAPNDMRRFCLVYDSFLSEFPLCYGYWKRYAGYKARFCTPTEGRKVYERAIEAATFSVDLWVCYCIFAESCYAEPADVRRLYQRALSFVGKDYLCYLLWDKYIEFEHSKKQWSRLAHIYINTLRFPTKKLHNYYERLKQVVAIWEEDMGCQNNIETPSDPVPNCDTTDTKACGYAEISNVISHLLDQEDGICKPKSVKKFKSFVELLYQKSSAMDRKISLFEARIRRPYFHEKPLDDCQLENWHQYLDFVEMQGDFDWTVKLYERCLIPCANYSEFWIRYVEFVDARGGRELAKFAIDRALTVFVKKVPAFHIFSAMFKEKIGDVVGARASFLQCGMNLTPDFVENVNREANRQKRMGNTDSACMIYEKAIEMAKEMKNEEILLALYTNFARFILVVSGSIDAAREVFIKGIQQMPCKFILEGLIYFLTTHGGAGQMPKLDSIVVNAITPGSDVSRALSYHDREDISKLFLQFVDLFGNIHEIRRAWERHWRLFPHIMRPPPPPPPPPLPPPPPITTTATTTTSYTIATENILLDKNMEERTGGFSASSRNACGGNSCDDADMHIINNPSIKNNAATPKNIPLENSTEGRNGLQIVSAHDACADSGHNGMDMHVMNDPALVNNAAILYEGNVTCDLQPEEHKNDTEGIEEPVEVAEVGQKQYTAEGDKVYVEAVHENHDAIQTAQATSVYAATENQIQRHANQESNAGLRSPALDNLSINSPDNKSQQFNPTISHDCIAQEVTFSSDGNILKDCLNSKGVSSKHVSNIVHARSGSPSRANLQKDKSLLHPACEQIPSEAQTNPQLQMQVRPEKDLQQASTVDDPYSQNASSGGNSTQVYYDGQAPENSSFRNHGFVQSSQTQQMLLPGQLQYSSAVTSSQMLLAQGYPCQPQAWTTTQNQRANPTQGQYAVADAAQVYSSGSLTWPGQNVQQQVSVYTQPQPTTLPSSQPQIQVYQHSQQGNEQYGYYQGSQGVQPHIWHYYQQQLYYWQQQQNQQLHNLPQQQWQIEHLQQLQQKLSQQRQAQSQQPPTLLQQQQQNQQPNHQEQQQQQLSPQQKHNQLLQQHESQFPQQSEQVDKTQHQHIMYLQQQQQQIYLQQQQLYLQQQQHLQLLEQQQNQQLFQQQQQQQQQLLQQQQQQQQLLHLQNPQPQQQQSIPVQHSSSQYGQQVVTSQGEGGRLLHAEQSVSSCPASPLQKAPPNH